MSSDSELSSVEEEQQNTKLNSIWKSIQETKSLGKHQYKDIQPSHQYINDQNYNEPASPVHSRHQESVNYSCQKKEEKHNLAYLLKKVSTFNEQNHHLKEQLQRVRETNEQETHQLRKEYEKRLKDQLKKIKSAEKQNRVGNKEEKTEQLGREIDRLTLRIKSLSLQNKKKQIENQRLLQINESYICRLGELEGGAIIAGTGKGQQLLQLQEANQTIQRLVQLLRRTTEYRQYAPLMQQVKSLHYLRNILKKLKASQLNFKPIEKKVCHCNQIKLNEKLLWSPTECYKIMLQMKIKYDYLSEDCIEEVLFQMNKIYMIKEEKSIRKVKDAYEQEIIKYRKQLECNYDELLAKRQINRLKKELHAIKNVQKSKIPPKLNNLRDKGQLEDQLKLKERQLKLLRERIKLLEAEHGFNDKSLYYEGVLWGMDKVLAELQTNQTSLKEFQIGFRDRIEQNHDIQDWLRSYKEFFQTLQQLGGGLLERVLGLKESALRKMGKAEELS